jgi:hypothetical protein
VGGCGYDIRKHMGYLAKLPWFTVVDGIDFGHGLIWAVRSVSSGGRGCAPGGGPSPRVHGGPGPRGFHLI